MNARASTVPQSKRPPPPPAPTSTATATEHGVQDTNKMSMVKDDRGKCNIYIPPHSASAIYRISIQIAEGITKVVEAVAQENGLTITVNATSVEALDEWIIYDENGLHTHTFQVGSPQRSNDSASPDAASGQEA